MDEKPVTSNALRQRAWRQRRKDERTELLASLDVTRYEVVSEVIVIRDKDDGSLLVYSPKGELLLGEL